MPRDVGPIGPSKNANTPKMQTGVTSGYDRKGNGNSGKGKGREEEPEPDEEEVEEEAHLDNDSFAARRNKVNTESFMNERMPWEVAEEERKRKLEEFNRKRAAMKGGKPRPHQPVKKDDKPAYEVRALGRQVEGGFDATSAVNSTLSAYNQLRERQQEMAKDQNAPKPAAHLDPNAVGPGIQFDPLTPPADRKPQPSRTDKFASWQSAEPASAAPNAGAPARPGTPPVQRPAGPGAQRPGTAPQRPGTAPLTPPAGQQRPAGPAKPQAEAPARPAAERPRPTPKPEPVAVHEVSAAQAEAAPRPVPAKEPVRPIEPVKAEAPAPVEPTPEPAVVEKVVPMAAAASMASKGDFACQYLIVDTFTGYGVPGARLEFEPISNDLLPVVNGTADTKGWYRTKDIPPGEYQLTVRYPGYIPESMTVNIKAGEMDEGQILLKRP